MLRTTDVEALNTQATKNKKNQDAPASAGGGEVGGNFENLSTVAKLAKSKKLKLTKSKKSELSKDSFAKVNSFGTDFLTPKAKKVFIHLRKTFTEAPVLRHLDSECHIRIKIDALGYAIGRVLSQMTSDQHSPVTWPTKIQILLSPKLANGT